MFLGTTPSQGTRDCAMAHVGRFPLMELPDDVLAAVLRKLKLQPLLESKSVCQRFRPMVCREVWARLCGRPDRPVPTSFEAVTDIDIEPFLPANGPGVAHVIDAMARFPNLQRMHAHGFIVDVVAVRGLGSIPAWQSVRGCIDGEGVTPGLLLAAYAAQCGETRVPTNAFTRCSSLASVELPAGFTSIGNGAFNNCTSLVSVELPAGLTSIGDYVFYG